MRWILKYITIEEEAQAMKAHICALQGLPQAVVLQTEGCERSKICQGPEAVLRDGKPNTIHLWGLG